MELFDVVDENGIPTGETVERTKAHAEGIRHRTAHTWVIREQGKTGGFDILLQKRAMQKDSFPGRFDTSSAGHIQAGDEPLSSACRELEEELGICAGPEELLPIGSFVIDYEREFYGKVFKDKEIAFVHIYREPVDCTKLVLQKEEVECVEWFDLYEVYEACKIRNPKFCVPRESLQMLIDYLENKKDIK